MSYTRNIFFVVASGGQDTDRHYQDTMVRKRTVEEASGFLPDEEAERLARSYRGRPFAVWGAVPGSNNTRLWEAMNPGDYVMIYRKGEIVLAAEVAAKTRNPGLSRHYWGEDDEGETWELIYFLINDFEVKVSQQDLNRYLNYEPGFSPRGFMQVTSERANRLLRHYGDLLSVLLRVESGDEPEEIDVKQTVVPQVLEERIAKAPTVHDEMQWRLIRLGNRAHFDVWVPKADQGRTYEGEEFRNLVIPEFHEALDIPSYVKNIDTVWKLGLSIKSAFEIEHSTSIYSGILRLSDLRALAPNSHYPLFIVAPSKRRTAVFDQLQRPTFANDYLRLDQAVRFLSYEAVRELDDTVRETETGYGVDWLVAKAEERV